MEELSIIRKKGKKYRHSDIPEPNVDTIRTDATYVEDSIVEDFGRAVAAPHYIWDRGVTNMDKLMVFLKWLTGLEGIVQQAPIVAEDQNSISDDDLVLLRRNRDAGRLGVVVNSYGDSDYSSYRGAESHIALLPNTGEQINSSRVDYIKLDEVPYFEGKVPIGERVRVKNLKPYSRKIKGGKSKQYTSNWREFCFFYADENPLNTNSKYQRYVYDSNAKDFRMIKSRDISLVSTYNKPLETSGIHYIVREALFSYESWMKKIIEKDNIEKKVGSCVVDKSERKMIEYLLGV